MNLAYKYPIIFWDCANLIVDSGTIEGINDKSSDYNKIARAVNKIKSAGISISLIDINKSELSFTPDVEANSIHYGLGGLQGVGNEIALEIIKNRPYSSIDDFMDKVKANKTVMVSLIKAGAFDEFMPREKAMHYYIELVSDTKQRLTLQNFAALASNNCLPNELKFQRQVFNFNTGLKKACKFNANYFALDNNDKYYRFYNKYFDDNFIEPVDNHICISKKNWKKQYDKVMIKAKEYIQENKENLLKQLNSLIVQENFNKYASGNISHWEMESLGTYSHEHELKNIDYTLYGISPFEDLPQSPVVDYTFKRNGTEFPIFKTYKIVGTVIAKDEMHSQITILTPENNTVNVKMSKEYFSQYNKRISEIMPNGTKKVREQSFFQRGTLVMLNGFIRSETFVLKAYKRKGKKQHQLYKITQVNPNGTIEMTNTRYGESIDK